MEMAQCNIHPFAIITSALVEITEENTAPKKLINALRNKQH